MSWLGLDLHPEKTIKEMMNITDRSTSVSNSWFRDTSILVPNAIFQHEAGNLDEMVQKVDVVRVEGILGYNFKEKSFLLEALTHASYVLNKTTRSNERLEVRYSNMCNDCCAKLNHRVHCFTGDIFFT